MKVIVTLDYWDGTRNKTSRPVDIEDVTGSLLMMLTERGAASVTLTRADSLDKIARLTGRAACPSVDPSTDGEAHGK